ncbi:hypothetical protein TYRP_009863 [Tyrophagus putrescentiae]|nr:hypothetical protein TYRP_009863 [Tyrophagus putrescentiae]
MTTAFEALARLVTIYEDDRDGRERLNLSLNLAPFHRLNELLDMLRHYLLWLDDGFGALSLGLGFRHFRPHPPRFHRGDLTPTAPGSSSSTGRRSTPSAGRLLRRRGPSGAQGVAGVLVRGLS